MILSNVQIYDAIDRGRIRLTPDPQPRRVGPGDDHSPYDTHSVDVRLANTISVPKADMAGIQVDLQPPGQRVRVANLLTTLFQPELIGQGGYVLQRNCFILGSTLEYLELPIDVDANHLLKRCIAARFEGKSSRARLGLLVHFTAPTIHPGFSGNITLEMVNMGPAPLVLRSGMDIGQLIFEEVDQLPNVKNSQFQGQRTPEGNRK